MKKLHTEIEIDASAERVWEALTDFSSMGKWNPFIRSLEGEAKVGERLKARVTPPGGRSMTFKATVLKADAGKELRWLGRTLIPGLLDGEEYFLIEAMDGDRIRFVHGELLMGILVPILGLLGVLKSTQAGFEEMNRALKERAESG